MGKTTTVNGNEIEVNDADNYIRFREGTPLEDIYEALGRKIMELNEDVRINAVINAFSYKDAAFQLHKALDRRYSFVSAKQNMFGGTDNSSLQVEVAPGVFVQVAWGKFEVPGVKGWLQTGLTQDAFGHTQLQVTGIVKRKHEKDILEAISAATQLVQTESIYKGRALEIRLKDDNGYALSEPDIKFVKVDPTLRQRVIFAEGTQDSIDINLYAPIEFREQARVRGIPLKRGILLYGPYGTGKTLSMDVAASLAVEHGLTYLKVARADDLADVMKTATRYLGPSVVTCEDVDQVLEGARDVDMNTLLNTIDTTDKDVELVVVLSTNHPEKINKAMLRAGRLDAAIYVAPPDADATERLMRQYGNGQIVDTEDISAAALLMAGNNAGDIRESIERAKLTELRRNPTMNPEPITGADLLLTAETMQPELELRRERPEDNRSEQVKAAEILREGLESSAQANVAAITAATQVARVTE